MARLVGAGGAHRDGPSVTRTPVSKATLEREVPSLRGKLDPPTNGKPPRGVSVRKKGDGTRVVSVNIHQAVPAGGDLKDLNRQDIRALRDVAAYVNAVDPDVVAVQEVRDHDQKKRPNGVPHQASVLYHLMGADDMAFTPALGETGNRAQKGREYGTAIYTRNGHKIEQAHNIDLPNQHGKIEDRSAGMAVVRAPNGSTSTVVNAHLTAYGSGKSTRHKQLREISRVVADAGRTGEFTYRDAITERKVVATGMPRNGAVIVAGDLNSRREDGPDDILSGRAGLHHANGDRSLVSKVWTATLASKLLSGGIDHVYVSDDLETRAYDSYEIPRDKLPEGAPTDHPMVVTDVQ